MNQIKNIDPECITIASNEMAARSDGGAHCDWTGRNESRLSCLWSCTWHDWCHKILQENTFSNMFQATILLWTVCYIFWLTFYAINCAESTVDNAIGLACAQIHTTTILLNWIHIYTQQLFHVISKWLIVIYICHKLLYYDLFVWYNSSKI